MRQCGRGSTLTKPRGNLAQAIAGATAGPLGREVAHWAKGAEGGPSRGKAAGWAHCWPHHPPRAPHTLWAGGSRGSNGALGGVGPRGRGRGGYAAPLHGVRQCAVGARGARHPRGIPAASGAKVPRDVGAGGARSQTRGIPPRPKGAGLAGSVPCSRLAPWPAGRAHIAIGHVEHPARGGAVGQGTPPRAGGVEGAGNTRE